MVEGRQSNCLNPTHNLSDTLSEFWHFVWHLSLSEFGHFVWIHKRKTTTESNNLTKAVILRYKSDFSICQLKNLSEFWWFSSFSEFSPYRPSIVGEGKVWNKFLSLCWWKFSFVVSWKFWRQIVGCPIWRQYKWWQQWTKSGDSGHQRSITEVEAVVAACAAAIGMKSGKRLSFYYKYEYFVFQSIQCFPVTSDFGYYSQLVTRTCSQVSTLHQYRQIRFVVVSEGADLCWKRNLTGFKRRLVWAV